MLETLTVWDVELTDTFGGEANYSWVGVISWHCHRMPAAGRS